MNRVGLGFDAHPFEDGRPLALGGLLWDSERGLAGHSDGDVLLHAMCDALLGAAGLGSLGELFSDRDPENRGRDSAGMLAAVAGRLRDAGWSIVNVDATLVGETPRISPRRLEMQGRVGLILGLPPERVSVKGTSCKSRTAPQR